MGSIVTKGKTQFFDNSGVPLAGGFVYMYVPGSTTPKTTWQDQNLTIANSNPITLDSGGEAQIWGSGSYQQVVTDSLGNQISSSVAAAPLSLQDVALNTFADDTGTANSYLVTRNPQATALTNGMPVQFKALNTNTGASTLNTDGFGAFPLYSGGQALLAGIIQAGQIYSVIYDSQTQLYNIVGQSGGTVGNQTVEGNQTIEGSLTVRTNVLAVFPGEIRGYGGPTAPQGWLLCQGQAISRTTYANLFAAIGTAWGTGDGSTTFNIPLGVGKTLVGSGWTSSQGANTALGTYGGEETHTLDTNEIPAHNHGVNDGGHAHTTPTIYNDIVLTSGANTSLAITNGSSASGTGSSVTGISIQNTGGGSQHNTMQPYMNANWIIST